MVSVTKKPLIFLFYWALTIALVRLWYLMFGNDNGYRWVWLNTSGYLSVLCPKRFLRLLISPPPQKKISDLKLWVQSIPLGNIHQIVCRPFPGASEPNVTFANWNFQEVYSCKKYLLRNLECTGHLLMCFPTWISVTSKFSIYIGWLYPMQRNRTWFFIKLNPSILSVFVYSFKLRRLQQASSVSSRDLILL